MVEIKANAKPDGGWVWPRPIVLPGTSACCKAEVHLINVPKQDGGPFVKKMCSACGKITDTLSVDEFLSLDLRVAYPGCGRSVEPQVGQPYKDPYFYACPECRSTIELGALVPDR